MELRERLNSKQGDHNIKLRSDAIEQSDKINVIKHSKIKEIEINTQIRKMLLSN